MTPEQNFRFSESLKDALRKEGLPVCSEKEWEPEWVDALGNCGGYGMGKEESDIFIPDDTIERLEARRHCMMCAILLGSIFLMGLLFAFAFWDDLGVKTRLVALLYGEVA